MDVCKLGFRLTSALALAVFVGYGTPASAQCSPTVYSMSGGPPIFIIKAVPAATMCTLTMFNNADCFPGGNYPPAIGAMTSGMSIYLSATQVTSPMVLTNPSCGWICNCSPGGTTVAVTTSAASDGLPVELMDFAIEDGKVVDDGDETGDRTEDGGDR